MWAKSLERLGGGASLSVVNNLSFEVCSTGGLRGRDDLKEKAETAERIFSSGFLAELTG